mgnify:CR=1 FL=1
MALTSIKFLPGIDKQDTAVGANGRWVDSDNARFRYGLPEKVGGWASLLSDTTIHGVARKIHAFVDTDGNRYVGIGTDKFLLIYFEGQLYDITPWRSNDAGVQTTFTSSTLATDSTSVKTCTITTTSAHSLEAGDMIVLDAVTLPGGTGLNAADFEDKLFQVLTVPTNVTFTINSENQAGSVVATGGSMTVQPYQRIGPAAQTYGYGFGVGNYGGNISGSLSNDLDGALNADAAGTGGVGTSVTLTSSTGFSNPGVASVGVLGTGELISYTGITPPDLTTITRGAYGTATPGTSNGQAHSDATIVYDATDWNGWGEAVNASSVTLEPGLWSLSNWGQVLVATVSNGKTFTWDSGISGSARFTARASTTTNNYATNVTGASGNPTASRLTLISPTTRHLIHLGTETTVGDSTTQDDMFIRFSDQGQINTYAPAADNSAGTYRLQDGTRIIGAIVAKENILVWTDNALYSMKFVGSPFTFGFEQVGTNCGLIGQNACCEIDGVAYWLSNNGFFAFDGTVNSLPCAVEDYVYDNFDTTKGQQVSAGINNLFTEVIWYYPSSGSTYNDKYVVFNYGESKQVPMGNWYTGVNTNSIRTSWIDAIVYPKPYSTYFNSGAVGTFPEIIGALGLGQTTFYEQETGTDQINPDGSTTALTSYIESYDIALQQEQPELFLAMRRFVPDFKTLTGNAKVTIGLKDYPSSTAGNSTFSPFTITSATTKEDTRARGRYASLKIENDSAGETWRFGTFQIDLQPDGRR